MAPSAAGRSFPPVTAYDASAGARRTVAADLDGTLLVSSSAFPYYFLVALEAGSYLRALVLLLAAPWLLVLYVGVSEAAAIGLLVFITFAGLRVRDVEAVARAVLPRHYAAGVRADTWAVFRGCGERRVVVTASPAVMVGEFVREFLGAEVAGTELETFASGKRFTGRIKAVLVGKKKREIVEKLFPAGDMPDVGLGDRESDHDFMAICKGAFYGSTARGWKFLDPYFFYMNPRPGYEVTFLPALKPEETCVAGGKSAVEVANHVQRVIAKELGFQCTTLTRKDKYMKLAGNDGRVAAKPKAN
uniref:Glycerol-3-phosphate acyltransferase RAM2/GPAT1-8 HAD-like domain-containing protein n=1 Tax=Oryza brachyantha TaxID=4533 RepID=J3L8X3_ORYBR